MFMSSEVVQRSDVPETTNKAALEETTSIDEVTPSDDFSKALLTSAEDEEGLDARYTTTRRELWSYYAYYIGNSGLGPFNFAPSQLQNLLSIAASNASGGQCGQTGQADCRLRWSGSDRTVQSIVLLASE